MIILMVSMSVFAERSSLAQVVAEIKAGTLELNVAMGLGDISFDEAVETGLLLKNVGKTGEIHYAHMVPGPFSHPLSYYIKIPEFKAMTIDGEEITQEYFKENVLTLVELWGTFCSPCIAKMHTIDAINSKYKDHGFAVLGIVTDGIESADEAKVIVEKKGVKYDNLLANKELNRTLL